MNMRIVFGISILSAGILIVFGSVLGIIVGGGLVPKDIINNMIIQTIGHISAIVWACTVAILWLDGCRKLILNWKYETREMNAVLLIFLLVGNLFAAYFFYFQKTRRDSNK